MALINGMHCDETAPRALSLSLPLLSALSVLKRRDLTTTYFATSADPLCSSATILVD